METIVLDGTCTLSNALDGSCSLTSQLDGVVDKVIEVQTSEYYTGDYVITPSSETVTLPTEQLMMSANVVINPVPSQYGLISWNGSTLTVS